MTLSAEKNQLLHQNITGILGVSDKDDAFGTSVTTGDFNRDGFLDVAIGLPGNDDSPTLLDTGAVQILYGSSTGLVVPNNQQWGQGIVGILDNPEIGDRFGSSVAAGDFDGDGHDDLAIGSPFDSVDGIEGAGVVNVIYGSPTGLSDAFKADQLLHQNIAGIPNQADPSEVIPSGDDVNLLRTDKFGSSMAVGDLNGDGRKDLVVGAHGEKVGGNVFAGGINIIYGSPTGLTTTGSQFITQDSSDETGEIIGAARAFENFGLALAVADFDADGFKDIAVNTDESDGRGAVQILYGSRNGIKAQRNQLWGQDSVGVLGVAEAGDLFGRALAAGDFNGDGFKDLAIGVLGQKLGNLRSAGTVQILYGSRTGLSAASNQLLGQDLPGVPGNPEEFESFGSSLTAADFDGDGKDDLVVGSPNTTINGKRNAGEVTVFRGTSNGLVSDRLWNQNAADQGNSLFFGDIVALIAGEAGLGDRFGASLAAGDFDNNGAADLIVGVPGETVGTSARAGAVNVLYGRRSGAKTASLQSDSTIPVKVGTAAGETLIGTAANGILSGMRGDDLIYTRAGHDAAMGGVGNDYLDAGAGNDILLAGKGLDTCKGSKGRDTFVLQRKMGMDQFVDFCDGVDALGLVNLEYSDLNLQQVARGTVVSYGTERLALLKGVQANQITAEDFVEVGMTSFNNMRVPFVAV